MRGRPLFRPQSGGKSANGILQRSVVMDDDNIVSRRCDLFGAAQSRLGFIGGFAPRSPIRLASVAIGAVTRMILTG